MQDDAPPPGSADPDEGVSLPRAVTDLLKDLPGLLTDRVHLLSLELQRAVGALGRMVAYGLAAAIFGATAWIALWAGFIAGCIALGLAWPWAVLIVLAVNLAAATWAALSAKALAPLLALPATLRRLTDSDSRERHDDSTPAP